MVSRSWYFTCLTVLIVAAVGAALLLTLRGSEAAVFVVNSTEDSDDSACDVAPGDCTLREAINAANSAAGADTITFSTTVFSPAEPATIPLESLLPYAYSGLTIDGTGAGVILEPAAGFSVEGGLWVIDFSDVGTTDFTLTGDSFTIRGFEDDGDEGENDPDGDGIFICGHHQDLGGCGARPVDGVDISGVDIYANDGEGIRVLADGVDDTTIDDVAITANLGDGVNVCCGTDVTVSGSTIVAPAGDAVHIEGGGGGSSDIDITGNPQLTGGEYGVEVLICVDVSCDENTNTVDVTGNTIITGGARDGVHVDVCVEEEASGLSCTDSTNTVHIDDNGDVNGGSSDQAVQVLICYYVDCEGSANSLSVNGNSHLEGGYDGVEARICSYQNGEGESCDGGSNTLDINGNGAASIIGREDDGIEAFLCYDQNCEGTPNTVTINDNGPIFGGNGDHAIQLSVCEGSAEPPFSCSEAGQAITISGNSEITGLYRGIEIDLCARLLCDGGAVTADITGNGPIKGGEDDSIEIDICTFSCNSLDTEVTALALVSAVVSVDISENASITGAENDQAINVKMCTGELGCNGLEGAPATVTTDIVDNGHVQGDDDAMELRQCTYFGCHWSTNSITITGHDGIQGLTDDALEIRQCNSGGCDYSTNTITVTDNGDIRGGDDDEGFDVEQCDTFANLFPPDYDTYYAGSCDNSTNAITATFNGNITSLNEAFEVEQCDGSGQDDFGKRGGGCNNSTNSFTVTDNGDIGFGDDEGLELEQCTGDGGCNNSENTVTIERNGEFEGGAGEEGIEIEQCVWFGYNGGCHGPSDSNVITIADNEHIFGEDDGVWVRQCYAGASEPIGACDDNTNSITITRNDGIESLDGSGVKIEDQCSGGNVTSCHNSTNTVTVTFNGDITSTDEDGVDVDQCSFFYQEGTGCNFSDNTITITDNGHLLGEDGDEGADVAQCDAGNPNGAGCNGGTNTIDISRNGNIEGDDEGIELRQCSGSGGCSESFDSNIVTIADNGFIRGLDDDGIEARQCNSGSDCSDSTNTFTISGNGPISGGGNDEGLDLEICSYSSDFPGSCERSVTTLEVTGNEEIVGHDEAIEMDLCQGEATCDAATVTVDISGNGPGGTIESIADDGMDVNICSGGYEEGSCSSTGDGQFLLSFLVDGNGPITGSAYGDAVEFDLCVGESVCNGYSNEGVVPAVFDIDFTNNGHISGGYRGFQVSICSFKSTACLDAEIGFNIDGNGPEGSITGFSDEGIDLALCEGLYNDSGFPRTGECDDVSTTLNVNNNGDISGGNGDEGIVIEVCPDESNDGICGDFENLFNITNNGKISGLEDGIEVEAGGMEAGVIPVELHVDDNGDITGYDGHGLNLYAYFVDSTINDNGTITGLGTDEFFITGVGVAQEGEVLYHHGINFGEDFSFESPGITIVEDTEISGNTLANSSGRGIDLADVGCCNDIHDNVIRDNAGAGIAITSGLLMLNGLVEAQPLNGDGFAHVYDNDILYNGGSGVLIENSSGNVIGPGNVLTGNGTGGTGVVVVGDSFSNTITQNSMNSNVGLGIDLNDDGVTPNDGGDGDSGPNTLLNYPEDLAVNNPLTGTACAGCTVEVFRTDFPPDPSGHGEGQVYLGSVVADGDGEFEFDMPPIVCQGGTAYVTTTATDTAGNTSEFSQNVNVNGLCTSPTPAATQCVQPRVTRTPVGQTPGVGATATPFMCATGSATATPTASPTPTVTSPTPTSTPSGGRLTRTPVTSPTAAR